MSQQLQLRRNTAPGIATFTGALGEVVVDTTNNRVVVQDAITAGGWAAAKLTEVSRLSFLKRQLDFTFTGDTTVSIALPQGMSIYRVVEVLVGNPSAVPAGSVRLGVYTAAAQGGTAIAAEQVLSGITTIAQNAAGNVMPLTLTAPTTTTFNVLSLFLNVGVASGTALKADVEIVIAPLS